MTRRLNSASIYDCPLYRSTSSTSAALHATFNEIKDLAYGFMERVRRHVVRGSEAANSLNVNPLHIQCGVVGLSMQAFHSTGGQA
jgi:hypothetical protein